MRRVTSGTTFRLQRRVFVSERALFIGVTLDTSSVCAGSQPGLLEFETAVWIVAVAALHGAFEYLVMKRHAKRRFHFTMATKAKLRLASFLHADRREARFLLVHWIDQYIRARFVFRDLVGQVR